MARCPPGLGLGAASLIAGSAAAQNVAIVTPYMAQPGTQFYVEAFQGVAADKGWNVNVIDTAGDVAAAISRIEDVVVQNGDANPQAREAIATGGNFEASVAQDFAGIGAATAEAVARVLDGGEIRQATTYVPTKLVTVANAAE